MCTSGFVDYSRGQQPLGAIGCHFQPIPLLQTSNLHPSEHSNHLWSPCYWSSSPAATERNSSSVMISFGVRQQQGDLQREVCKGKHHGRNGWHRASMCLQFPLLPQAKLVLHRLDPIFRPWTDDPPCYKACKSLQVHVAKEDFTRNTYKAGEDHTFMLCNKDVCTLDKH